MTSKRPFHILAKPSGSTCNLDCEYCFYLEKEELYPNVSKFRMDDQTQENYIRQYINSQPMGTQEVNFGWQGGEPTLMGIAFFEKAMELQEKYKRPGMQISNAIQTNGTLLNDDWGKFLHDHNFLVGLSVDGPEEMHDHYRVDKGKKPTFFKVMEGLDTLQKHNVEYNTLTVVQDHNCSHPQEVYDFLVDIGSKYLQFIPIVYFSEELNKTFPFSVGKKDFGLFLNGIFDRWLEKKDMTKISVQHFDMLLGVLLGQGSSLCVHSETCGNCLAIEHNGDLYSCDHFVNEHNNLGNINDIAMFNMVDSDFQTKFGIDKKTTLPKDCRECQYLEFCHGGCPKDRYIQKETGEWGDNYLCASYKTLYSHTLPVLEKIAYCIKSGKPIEEYANIGKKPTEVKRNDSCPCGSGKKYKSCCLN